MKCHICHRGHCLYEPVKVPIREGYTLLICPSCVAIINNVFKLEPKKHKRLRRGLEGALIGLIIAIVVILYPLSVYYFISLQAMKAFICFITASVITGAFFNTIINTKTKRG